MQRLQNQFQGGHSGQNQFQMSAKAPSFQPGGSPPNSRNQVSKNNRKSNESASSNHANKLNMAKFNENGSISIAPNIQKGNASSPQTDNANDQVPASPAVGAATANAVMSPMLMAKANDMAATLGSPTCGIVKKLDDARMSNVPFELDARHNNLLHMHVETIKSKNEKLDAENKDLKRRLKNQEALEKQIKELSRQLVESRNLTMSCESREAAAGDFNRFVVGYHSASRNHIDMLGMAQVAFVTAGQDFVNAVQFDYDVQYAPQFS